MARGVPGSGPSIPAGVAFVDIIPNMRQFAQRLTRDMSGQRAAIAGAGVLVGGAILTGLARTIGQGLQEAVEEQVATAGLRNALRNAAGKEGVVMNVTVAGTEKTADDLQRVAGIADDMVLRTASWLGTFHNLLRDQDTFDRAIRATADLAAAQATARGASIDMTTAQNLMAKALQDPVKGLTALGRAGVQFTQDQKDQIKALVEGRDIMEVLAHVYPDLTEKQLAHAESMLDEGKTVKDVAKRYNQQWTPALQKAIDKNVEGGEIARAQGIIFAEVENQVKGAAEAYGETVPGMADRANKAFGEVKQSLAAGLLPVLVTVSEWFQKFALFLQDHPALVKVVAIAIGVLAVSMIGLSVAMFAVSVAAAPVALLVFGIVAALVAVGIALVVAWHKFETFRNVVNAVIDFVTEHWEIFLAVFTGGLGLAVAKIIEHFGDIKGAARRLGQFFTDDIPGFFRRAWRWVQDIVFNAQNAIIRKFLSFAESFIGVVDKAFGWIPGVGDDIDGIKEKISKMREEAELASHRRYAIRFVTNAANVKSDIEDMRAGLFRGFGADGVVSVNMIRSAGLATNPGGLTPRILDELGVAQAMGLTLTSGLRRGAITSTGNRSLHSIGHAIDVAGSAGQMAAFFRAMLGRPGIAELLYSPIGGWYGSGGIVPLTGSVLRDHFSHVHVGVYDAGGFLPEGWSLAGNFTGAPEPVGMVTGIMRESAGVEQMLRDGLRIRGKLDLGDGLEGTIDGVLVETEHHRNRLERMHR